MDRIRTLEKLITGKEKLGPSQVKDMLKGPMDPVLILYIFVALREKLLDPNLILVQAISVAIDEDLLIPIGLALRSGADPNLYVNTIGVGSLHILAYTYYKLPNKNLTNYIVLMMIASGSRAVLPASDDTGGRYMAGKNRALNGPSVIEWLEMNKYQTIVPDIEVDQQFQFRKVEKAFLTSVGELLDRPDLVLTEVSTVRVIRAHSYNILSKLGMDRLDIETNLSLSIRYLNLRSFELFLEEGAKFTYLQMNKVLIMAKQYKKQGLTLAMSQIGDMVKQGVDRNVGMDKEQYALLNSIDRGLAKQVLDNYKKPRWEKECSLTKTVANPELKSLAISLGIDLHDKTQICQELSKVQEIDPSRLTLASIKRQRNRISNDLSSVSDYLTKDPNVSAHVCSNKTLFEEDPYTYSDWDLEYYRDRLGISWCFTSDMFEDLVSTGVNPYTDEPIPTYFVRTLELKKQMLDSLPDRERPKTIKDGLSKLSQPDNITNKESNAYLNILYEESTKYNVGRSSLDKLTPSEIESVLIDGGVNTDTRDLTTLHSRFTLARVLYPSLTSNGDLASRVFSNIFKLSKTRKST